MKLRKKYVMPVFFFLSAEAVIFSMTMAASYCGMVARYEETPIRGAVVAWAGTHLTAVFVSGIAGVTLAVIVAFCYAAGWIESKLDD